MKQLYSARNGLEAHDLRLFLESQGIEAKVFGDNNALEIGFAFTPASAPGVFVDEADFEGALELLEEFENRDTTRTTHSTWVCENCGEVVEAPFDTCWKCEAPRGEVATPARDEADDTETVAAARTDAPPTGVASVATESVTDETRVEATSETWLEVMVVLAVAWLPNFFYSVLVWIWPDQSGEWSYVASHAWQFVEYFAISVVVLYMIHRGPTPWPVHGIRKPRPFTDAASGLLIWMVQITAVIFAYSIVESIIGADQAGGWTTSTYEFDRPNSPSDVAALIILCLGIGFSEELAMRGYLIPRLEQLLGSTPKSVLLSTVIFASYHLYQGIGATAMICVIGLVYGIAFCLTRRLWPVAIAHAATDVFAML